MVDKLIHSNDPEGEAPAQGPFPEGIVALPAWPALAPEPIWARRGCSGIMLCVQIPAPFSVEEVANIPAEEPSERRQALQTLGKPQQQNQLCGVLAVMASNADRMPEIQIIPIVKALSYLVDRLESGNFNPLVGQLPRKNEMSRYVRSEADKDPFYVFDAQAIKFKAPGYEALRPMERPRSNEDLLAWRAAVRGEQGQPADWASQKLWEDVWALHNTVPYKRQTSEERQSEQLVRWTACALVLLGIDPAAEMALRGPRTLNLPRFVQDRIDRVCLETVGHGEQENETRDGPRPAARARRL